MGFHRTKCPCRLQTYLCKHATRSFSEMWISLRGFDPMKNDRVQCLTTKLSKQMIWVTQNFTLRTKFTLRSPRGSKIQNLKALDNESNGFWNAWMLSGSRSKVMAPDVGSHGCLKCLNCLQASRLTPEQIDGWKQTFSGPHDCPALRFVPAWVIHCIVTARKNMKESQNWPAHCETWKLYHELSSHC